MIPPQTYIAEELDEDELDPLPMPICFSFCCFFNSSDVRSNERSRCVAAYSKDSSSC